MNSPILLVNAAHSIPTVTRYRGSKEKAVSYPLKEPTMRKRIILNAAKNLIGKQETTLPLVGTHHPYTKPTSILQARERKLKFSSDLGTMDRLGPLARHKRVRELSVNLGQPKIRQMVVAQSINRAQNMSSLSSYPVNESRGIFNLHVKSPARNEISIMIERQMKDSRKRHASMEML